jgi:hypothetical protein
MKAFLLLLAILPYCSFGQGLYTTGSQSATAIQTTYSATRASVSSQGIEIGHSIGDLFDIGVQMGRGRLDSYYNAMFYGLKTSVYINKPNRPDGAIISLDAAYRKLEMKYGIDPYNGDPSLDHHGDEYTIGLTGGTRIQLAPILTILPLGTLGVVTTSDQLQFDSGPFYWFGLSCIVRTGNLTQIVVTPSVSITNDFSTFGLKGGFLFLQ